MATKALKERLIEELEKLPEDRPREIFDFVGYLRAREAREAATRSPEELHPQKDPILKFIERVFHSSPIPGD